MDSQTHEHLLGLAHMDKNHRSFRKAQSEEFLERCTIAQCRQKCNNVKFVVKDLLIYAPDVPPARLNDIHASDALCKGPFALRIVDFTLLLKLLEQCCLFKHSVDTQRAVCQQHDQALQSTRINNLLNHLGGRRWVQGCLLATSLRFLRECRVVVAKGNGEGRFALPEVRHGLVARLDMPDSCLRVYVVLEHHVQILNLEFTLIVATHQALPAREERDVA